jgi:hypothetical protein
MRSTALCLYLVASMALAAPAVNCPQRLRVMQRAGQLHDGRLFVGLPELRHELRRAPGQHQWDLATLQQQAGAGGLVLMCVYRGLGPSISMAVPRTARTCTVARGADRLVHVGCG